jgi:predicted Zn-dependent protease
MGLIRTWLARRTRGTRLTIVAIAVALLAISGYRAYRTAAAASHFRVAQTAAVQNDFPATRRHLTACLAEWPNDSEVNFLMARAARRDCDYATAARFLTRAKTLGWATGAIQMESILLAGQTGDFRRTESRILQWALLGTDEQGLFLEVLIPNYLLRHDLAQALDLLTAWTEREPKNVRALLWLVETCERLQLPERAMNAARAAAAAAPDRADVRAKCGLILVEFNQMVEARPHLDRAVALAPEDRAARLGLARCLHALGETSAANRLLDELLANQPDDPDVLVARGMIALESERPAEAEHYLKRAVNRAPSDLEALYNLAVALKALGKADEAKTYLDRHQAAKKDLAELTETTKAVAKDPRNPDLRYRAGMILLRNGHTEGGLRWIQSALAENPAHEPSRKVLAATRSKCNSQPPPEGTGY